MSEGASVSAEDVAALRRELDELRTAHQALQEATTKKEKEAAREDVAEAKADLDKLAADLGISRAALEDATREARKAERRSELSPIVDELIEEKLAKLAEEDDDEPTPDAEPPLEPAAKKPPVPKVDDGPVATHWSDRSLSELLK